MENDYNHHHQNTRFRVVFFSLFCYFASIYVYLFIYESVWRRRDALTCLSFCALANWLVAKKKKNCAAANLQTNLTFHAFHTHFSAPDNVLVRRRRHRQWTQQDTSHTPVKMMKNVCFSVHNTSFFIKKQLR